METPDDNNQLTSKSLLPELQKARGFMLWTISANGYLQDLSEEEIRLIQKAPVSEWSDELVNKVYHMLGNPEPGEIPAERYPIRPSNTERE
jgi:hypothetical protein